jgi:hypothetical protein
MIKAVAIHRSGLNAAIRKMVVSQFRTGFSSSPIVSVEHRAVERPMSPSLLLSMNHKRYFTSTVTIRPNAPEIRALDLNVVKKIMEELRSIDSNSDER